MKFKYSLAAIDTANIVSSKFNLYEFERTSVIIRPVKKPVNNIITRTYFKVKKKSSRVETIIKLWKRRRAMKVISSKFVK